MSDVNDQLSDTSSDLNWPLDHSLERQQHDRVVFENVPDQYTKGNDVTAFFTILNEIKINPEEDQIGLLRVGCTNIKECIAYASVRLNPSVSGSTCHGTATFPSASLPVTDDEFYQFCYIIKKTKNLGSSIPFQLNCTPDDIDLLTNVPVRKADSNGFIALADHDNDDFLVIHTKHRLIEEKLRQENRQLSDVNRRLELEREEYKVKVELFEKKMREHIDKTYSDMQALTVSHKLTVDELTSRKQLETKLRAEYDVTRELCNQYQTDSLKYAERCRTVEEVHVQTLEQLNQVRSQLAATSQLIKEQATKIIDFEHCLKESNELLQKENERYKILEQELRDFRLTSEKHERSMQGQIQEYVNKLHEKELEIRSLEEIQNLLNEQIHSLKCHQEQSSLRSKNENESIRILETKLHHANEKNESMENEIKTLENVYLNLKNSYVEVEKRCLKHQRSEIDVKRQLGSYKNLVIGLQREIQDLTERLTAGAEEYKTLFRKCTLLEQTANINQREEPSKPRTPLTNSTSANTEEITSLLSSRHNDGNRQEQATVTNELVGDVDGEVYQCPMCYCEFSSNMTLNAKQEHIESHFQ